MPFIAAGIGAAAKIGGSFFAGRKAKKQAKKASALAAKQAAADSALAQVVRQQNQQLYAPTIAQGQQAGNVLMQALLGNSAIGAGGTAGGAVPAYVPPAMPSAQEQYDYLTAGMSKKNLKKLRKRGGSIDQQLAYAKTLAKPHQQQQYSAWMMEHEPSVFEQYGLGAQGTGTGGATAKSALDSFLESTNYQYELDQKLRAQNMLMAGGDIGAFSPAAAEAMRIKAGNEARGAMGNWMSMLSHQQGLGQNATGAYAGEGSNYFDRTSGANNAATQAKMNQYGVTAQAAGNLYGAIGEGIGQVAGAAFNPPVQAPAPPPYQYYAQTPPPGYGTSSYAQFPNSQNWYRPPGG